MSVRSPHQLQTEFAGGGLRGDEDAGQICDSSRTWSLVPTPGTICHASLSLARRDGQARRVVHYSSEGKASRRQWAVPAACWLLLAGPAASKLQLAAAGPASSTRKATSKHQKEPTRTHAHAHAHAHRTNDMEVCAGLTPRQGCNNPASATRASAAFRLTTGA